MLESPELVDAAPAQAYAGTAAQHGPIPNGSPPPGLPKILHLPDQVWINKPEQQPQDEQQTA